MEGVPRMAKILKMQVAQDGASATTAPQDISKEQAVTFDVLRQMREDILCCVLKPEQKLRFEDLRQRYGTSISALREALSHLVSEGLVRTVAGRGFQVAPTSLADFLDLSELRVYLETKTLADAIRHGNDAWEAEIVSSHFLLTKLGRPQADDPASAKLEWSKRHKHFHDALVSTCTSPWSLHFRSELFDQARRYHWLTMIHSRSRRRDEHLELRDAALARNVDKACALMEQHIRLTVEQATSEVPGLVMTSSSRASRSGKRRNA